ncbi:MAG: helix-turn-helix transcriptional regulator [Oscillospiraceae bacterium]|nr:helix-turn-helix transcriptional regulator [Oscillospiraceae bacterium]
MKNLSPEQFDEIVSLERASLDKGIDLLAEFADCRSLRDYLDTHEDSFVHEAVPSFLDQMITQSGLTKAALSRRSATSEVYLHQILSGRRSPSRDRLLCLCLAMEAPLSQVQVLLAAAAYAELYISRRRDVILAYCLLHRKTVDETNELLDDLGEDLLI